MIRICTQTSTYIFDEGGRYLRMPKSEHQQRSDDEQWQQILSGGPMDDHQWNDLREVHFTRHPLSTPEENPSLNVQYVGSRGGIVTTSIADESIEDARRLVAPYEMEEEDSYEENKAVR